MSCGFVGRVAWKDRDLEKAVKLGAWPAVEECFSNTVGKFLFSWNTDEGWRDECLAALL